MNICNWTTKDNPAMVATPTNSKTISRISGSGSESEKRKIKRNSTTFMDLSKKTMQKSLKSMLSAKSYLKQDLKTKKAKIFDTHLVATLPFW